MNRKGKYQGAICGDFGSYDVYADGDVTYGYRWGNENDNPDYVGTESGLRVVAGAKFYTRSVR